MIIGVPKEIKTAERRVGLPPPCVKTLTGRGQEVLVEETAGMGSGFLDEAYVQAGAKISRGEDIWAQADMIVKVKEPIGPEFGRMRSGQVLFTYLHLAADGRRAKGQIFILDKAMTKQSRPG